MYSPSLKDVAWLEDAQLIFRIFHIFVCKFGWVDKRLDAVRGKKIERQMYGKLKKIISATYRKATSFKLAEYNLLPCILTLRFRNCEKFNFGRSYLLSDSHTNTVISDSFAYRQDAVENRDKAYCISLMVIATYLKDKTIGGGRFLLSGRWDY